VHRIITATDGELVEQARCAHVGGSEAMAARALGEGRSQPALPDPSGPGDQEIVVIANPGAGAASEGHVAYDERGIPAAASEARVSGDQGFLNKTSTPPTGNVGSIASEPKHAAA
jgi:hypothetical protein